MFSLRIVTTDHYISSPLPGLDVQYSDLRGSAVKKVPVVRIFGATPAGQKTCMHVHGVFPYLYVPYDGTAPWEPYLRQFSTSLDRALNVALGYGQSNIQHVYKIVLVSGRSMYGYHEKEQQFLKIYLYNPAMVKKAADLLLGGAVLNKPFQPHESHIPYTLQLFIDYNLYGMNMINVAAVKFRCKPDENLIPGSPGSDEGLDINPNTSSFPYSLNRSGSVTPSTRFWEQENIPSELCIDAERQSTCALEVDVVAADILNRLEVNANVGANPGLAALWEDERERLRDRGLPTDDIAPPSSPGRVDVDTADSEQMLQERLRQIILDLEPFMDSQSESDGDISQEDVEIPSTPSSQLDLHLSQREEDFDGSQDTVMLEDTDDKVEEVPIVNMESIKRVVSASQSFRDVMPQMKQIESQDKSLVDILAALADENAEPSSSQAAASQLVGLEEQDSVLSLTPRPCDMEDQPQDAAEIMEMSQRIWDGDGEADIEEQKCPDGAALEYDLAGLDETWPDSQLAAETGDKDEEDVSDADSDIIPQYDGAVDEQPTGLSKKQVTKRLGIHGSATNMATGVGPQFNNFYGNPPGYPPMPRPGQQQRFNSQGFDSLQSSTNQNPPWQPGPMPPGMGQYPPAANQPPWHPTQRWGGANTPQQLPFTAPPYNRQPRPQAFEGPQMPSYRPRPDAFSPHMNSGFFKGQGQSQVHIPSHPKGPDAQHTGEIYHQNRIPTENLGSELQYPGIQRHQNKTGFEQPNNVYNQQVSPSHIHAVCPGPYIRGQVQKEVAPNFSPRKSSNSYDVTSSGNVIGAYGHSVTIPEPTSSFPGSCITPKSSDRSQLSHMAIAGSGGRPHDNHMEALRSSNMAIPQSSHMTTTVSSHMKTVELANIPHNIPVTTIRSTDGLFERQIVRQVPADLLQGGCMVSPGSTNRPLDRYMTPAGLTEKSPGNYMTSPGSLDKSHASHITSPVLADRSSGCHMNSPGSADRPYGSHIVRTGSLDILSPIPVAKSQAESFNMQMSPGATKNIQSGGPIHQSTGYILKRPANAKTRLDNTTHSLQMTACDQTHFQGTMGTVGLVSSKSNDEFHSSEISSLGFPSRAGIVHEQMMVPQQTNMQYPSGIPSKYPEGFSHGRNRPDIHRKGQNSILSTYQPPSSKSTGQVSHSNYVSSLDRPLGSSMPDAVAGRVSTLGNDKMTCRSSRDVVNQYELSGDHLKNTQNTQAGHVIDSKSSSGYVIKRPYPSDSTYPVSKPVSAAQSFPMSSVCNTRYSSEEHQPMLSPVEKQNYHANFQAQMIGENEKAADMIRSQNSDPLSQGSNFEDIVQSLDAQQQAAFNRGRQSIRSVNLINTGTASQCEAVGICQQNPSEGNYSDMAKTSPTQHNISQVNVSKHKNVGRPKKNSIQLDDIKKTDILKGQHSSVFPFDDDFVGPVSKYYAKKIGKHFTPSASAGQMTNQSLSLLEISPVSSSTTSPSERFPDKTAAALQKILLDSESATPKHDVKSMSSRSMSLSSSVTEQCSRNAADIRKSITSSLTSPVMGSGDSLLRSPGNMSGLFEQNRQSTHHRHSLDSSRSRKDSSMSLDASGSQEDLFVDRSSYTNNSLVTTSVPTCIATSLSTVDLVASQVDSVTENSSVVVAHSLREQSESPLTVISINPSIDVEKSKHSLEYDPLLSSLETFVGSVTKGVGEQFGVNFTKPDTGQSSQHNVHSNSCSIEESRNIGHHQNPYELNNSKQMQNNLHFSDSHQQLSTQVNWPQSAIDHNFNSLPQACQKMDKPKKRTYTKRNPAARSLSVPGEAVLKRKRGRPRKDSFVNSALGEQQSSQQQVLQFQQSQFTQNKFALPEHQYLQQKISDFQKTPENQQITQETYQPYSQSTQFDDSQEYDTHPGQPNTQNDFRANANPSQLNTQVQGFQYYHQLPQSVLSSQQQLGHTVDNHIPNMQQVQQFEQSQHFEMGNFQQSSFLQELESIDNENFQEQNHSRLPIPQNPVAVPNLSVIQTHLPQMPQYQLSELLSIQRKVTSMPLPYKSYTYKFPISAPLSKAKNEQIAESNIVNEFVMMHPNDARKYSLLKIGQEVVKLVNLSEEEIEEVQHKLVNGISVEAIPPPLRTAEAIHLDSSSLNSDKDNLKPNLGPHELEDNSIGSDLNASKLRKQFEVKDKNKVKSMFKNKNIANVPHLKKYRAGFPYFGRGHIGKKSVKHFNPIVGPDFEDDENIVLHDVNLTEASEGTLTPLKSRTPIAGRSPSHSAGNVMSDLDSHENKEYLDTKLKSLEHDESELCLNSQNNTQADMFDNELFEEKHESHSEESASEHDIDNEKDIKKDDEDSQTTRNQVKDSALVKNDNIIKNDSTDGISHGTSESVENFVTNQGEISINEPASELSDAGTKYLSDISEKENISMNTVEIHAYESKSKKSIHENEQKSAEVFFGKFKKHFEEKMANSKNLANAVMKPKILNKINHVRSRSSSSESVALSSVSASRSNSVGTSSDGLQLLTESSKSVFDNDEFARKSVNKRRSSSDKYNICEVKRQKSSTSSSKSGSRRSSRHNSSDWRKPNGKRRKNCYDVDYDSDGVPGVDYIVTGRFRGHKSMKVVLHKLEIDDTTELLNTSDFINCVSNDAVLRGQNVSDDNPGLKTVRTDGMKYSGSQNPVVSCPVTGFSAEFEKFVSKISTSQSESDQKIMFDGAGDTDSNITHDNGTIKPDEIVYNETGDLKNFHKVPGGNYLNNDSTCNTTLLDEETCENEFNSSMNTKSDKKSIENIGNQTDCRSTEYFEGFSNKFSENISSKSSDTSFITNSINCEIDNVPLSVSASFKDKAAVLDGNSVEEVENVSKDLLNQTLDSSSVDEYINEKKSKKTRRKSHKNKNKTRHDRLSQAFVSKRRKKRHVISQSSKLMTTLSVLHDATMENLSIKDPFSDFPISNISPFYNKDSADNASSIKSTNNIKSTDLDVYAERVDDVKSCYADTMFKFALFSPPDSEIGELTPPQPLSPDEIIKVIGGENKLEVKEERITLADIQKSMHQSSIPLMGQEFYETPPASSVETIKSKENSPNSNVSSENVDIETGLVVTDKNMTENKELIKTAVVKLAPLTLKDIQSICAEENENEAKKSTLVKAVEDHSDNISPPDLGPPNIPRFSPRQHSSSSSSTPPDLVPSQQPHRNPSSDSESSDGKLITQCSGVPCVMESNDFDCRPPPFLIPCRSPRVAASLTNSLSPRVISTDGEIKSYFSIPIDHDSKNRFGRSPGANSSSGSINIVKSEEFSDISDDDGENSGESGDSEVEFDAAVNNSGDTANHVKTNTTAVTRSDEFSISLNNNFLKKDILNKDDKLKEIAEFEKKLKEADKCNKEILSSINNANIPDSLNTQSFPEYAHTKNIQHNIYGLNNKACGVTVANRHTFMHVSGNCSSQPDMHDVVSKEDVASNKDKSQIHPDVTKNKMLITDSHHRSDSEIYLEGQHISSFQISSFNSNYISGVNSRDLFESTAEDGIYSGINLKSDFNSGDLFDSTNLSNLQSANITNISHTSHPHAPLVNMTSDSVQLSDYLINRNSRFSDSVIKSLAQHSLRNEDGSSENISLSTNNNVKANEDVPFNTFGTGDKKCVGPSQSGATQQQTPQQTSAQGAGDGSDLQQSAGGDTGNDQDGQGMDTYSCSELHHDSQVITPLTLPPTKESIEESASLYGLSAVQAQDAYYGNPKDAVQRPREGGGLVLRVASNMLKDLREFECAEKTKGIKDWRATFCVSESWYSSQSNTEDLSEKLEKEPALKYALTGDTAFVISPCVLPPSRTTVEKWLDGRKLYKTLKNQAIKQKGQEPESCQAINQLQGKTNNSKADSESTEKTKHKPSEMRLNLFTGKREVITTVQDMDKEPSQSGHATEETDTKSAAFPCNTDQSFEIDPSPVTTPGKDDGDGSSHLHSTPVARRMSTDLFATECTPIEGIVKDVRDKVDDQGNEFMTPKGIKPLRRLSTNTDARLRRTILTSQMKRQFCTPAQAKDTSQIEGPSPKNSFGFRVSQQNFQEAKALHENQFLTVMCMELHVETRGDLRPDPEFDSIQAIFYTIHNDVPPESGPRQVTGVILIDPVSANQEQAEHANKSPGPERLPSPNPKRGPSRSHEPASQAKGRHSPAGSRSAQGRRLEDTLLQKSGISGLDVLYAKNEKDLLDTFIQFVHRWDPDILVGFEIQMLSWGYLRERASTLGTNLASAISRIPQTKPASRRHTVRDEIGGTEASEMQVSGRIVINLWTLLRHEVTLNVYTFENLAFHVLHRRVPLFSFRNLTAWYKHRTHLHRWKVVVHYMTRVQGCLEMIQQLDLIGRTSEFARVFGIEFYHVLSRGTQYRVESMMLRVAKPLNFIPVSPSVHQRARMKAPECIPLTLEPESRFYTDPVVLLDFQSLYPSIMIAYNYCFSTCLGRVEWLPKCHDGSIQFGCTSLDVPPSVLKKRQRQFTISPNGVVFCTQAVKRGVLPVMVEEILNTRLMVKKAMKGYKGDKTLTRMLHARQLGLKLIANVTYGYTAANFSGRMPCIEVGDSIVRKARETLERSIKLVRDTPEWGARVIYGDTDSMFLQMKGKTKDEAFRIGQEIADAVTAMFPKPIKLKFEKVYLPCVLEAKKRYFGYMYETPDQKDPVYDAKGIETVRRDSCAAVSKMLERSIKILFNSRDVSQVKAYVQQQCQKLMEGTVSLQDSIFAKEYRGMPGYKPGACVPGLEIAKKLLRQDRRAEPRAGERVPYVIVYGTPGLPLIQLVRRPSELLQDPTLRLNATYYITKQILPPLHRFLVLLGVDVFSWYQEMPHVGPRGACHAHLPQDAKKGTISQYFSTSNCPLCDKQTKQKICTDCMKDPQMVCSTLNGRISRWDRIHSHLVSVCSTCVGCSEPDSVKACVSLDCPVLYRMSRAQGDFNRAEHLRGIIEKLF